MNNDFKKRAIDLLLSAVVTAIIVIAAGYGYNVTVLEPLLTEGQAEGRGSGITRFNTDVQFLNSLSVGNDITVADDFAVTDDSTLTGDLTVSGAVALPTGEIGAAEIANITRTVNLPLMVFIECSTNGGALINFTDGADAFPDFINSSTDGLGFVLAFDASTADASYVCAQLSVPQDYISGGAITVEATKSAETGANSEVINCAGSINGAALGTAGTVTTSGTAAARYVCTPTLTSLAAGNSLGIELHITSGGTVDDTVNFLAVAFEYTASE